MEKNYKLIDEKDLQLIFSELTELKQLVQGTKPAIGDWITAKEAMRILSKKATSLYKLRKKGDLLATTTRPVMYSLKSIQRFLDKQVSKCR